MKIRFRTGAVPRSDQRNERSVEQPSRQQQNWPVTPPSTRSLESPVSTRTPPAENSADRSLRRGAACCARCNAADQNRPLATSRSMPGIAYRLQFRLQPAGKRTALAARESRKNLQFSGISNRFCAKNRSYRKQTIKPSLTGSRTDFSLSTNSIRILGPKTADAQLSISPHEGTRVRYGILIEGASPKRVAIGRRSTKAQ
jgi:hypothetical protein